MCMHTVCTERETLVGEMDGFKYMTQQGEPLKQNFERASCKRIHVV